MGKIDVDLGVPISGETPIDPSRLRPSYKRWVRNRRQLNVVEADNVRLAHEKYLRGTPSRRLAPFTCEWVKRLSKDMLGKVWTWAGSFRREDLSGPWSKWFNIELELTELLKDLSLWPEGGMPFVEQAAMLHHRAVLIHPFLNGNGRWARMLSNIWLRQNGADIIHWPETNISAQTSPVRDEYIGALELADKGDYEKLNEMHQRFTTSAPT